MARTFLRPGSIRICRSVEGHGTPPSVHDYPHQGIGIEVEPYRVRPWADDPWFWLEKAKGAAEVMRTLGPAPADISAGRYKHWGQRTPLGTSVAELTRKGHDMLSSSCGECGKSLGLCRCAFVAQRED